MTVQFLDLYKQYRSIKEEVDAAISDVISKSAFIGGSFVETFEGQFASYQQAEFCVGVGNGTDALEIALEALDLPPGSEVLVPANSFIASSEAITRAGHRVVFCDCDEVTYTISLKDAENRITEKTAAIIAVHLYGHSCDMDAVMAFAKKNSLRVIEDSAQAHGAEFRGRRVGAIGDIGTFSFYPGKNLGAYGDGGAIVTNDQNLAKRCRMIANHGRVEKYNHEFEGRNSRLDGMQAAILSVKLKHLEGWIDQRRNVARQYNELLSDAQGITLPREAAWARHVWHLYVVRSEHRDVLANALKEQGIQTGIHYPISLPKLKAYSYLQQQDAPLLANCLGGEILSLPMGEHLSREEIEAVTSAVMCSNGRIA